MIIKAPIYATLKMISNCLWPNLTFKAKADSGFST